MPYKDPNKSKEHKRIKRLESGMKPREGLKYGISPKDDWKEYCRRRLIDQMKRDPLIRIISTSRYRAKKEGYKFTITKDDLIVPTHCPITGLELAFNEGKRQHNTYSLDRVDNSKGYIPGNVRVISWRANRIKSNLSLQEIENLYVYSKQQ